MAADGRQTTTEDFRILTFVRLVREIRDHKYFLSLKIIEILSEQALFSRLLNTGLYISYQLLSFDIVFIVCDATVWIIRKKKH